MRKVNFNIKSESASSSVMVLITVLTFLSILTGVYVIVMNRAQNQIRSDMKIQEIYKNEVDRADEIYDEIIENFMGRLNVTATPYGNIFDGQPHGIAVTCEQEGATITYSTTGLDGSYTETNPTYTSVGEYITYYIVELEGYIKESGSLKVVIDKAQGDLTLSSTSGTYTYPTSGTFTVTNNVSGGTITATSSNDSFARVSVSGNVITVLPQPLKSSSNETETVTITVRSESTQNYQSKEVTYTATINKGKLTVTYYKNDGTNTSQTGTIYNSVESNLLTNVFSRTGYQFVKWNTAANGSGTDYTNKITTNQNISLYAQWNKTDVSAPTVTITMANSPDYLFAIESTVQISDASGVDYNHCKYVYTTSSSAIGTNEALYTGGTINSATTNITKVIGAGTYYLHVLATDICENKIEKVSPTGITIAQSADFSFTGTVQTANLLPGSYKLEAWGAQGIYSSANYSNSWTKGYGGYASGILNLGSTTTFYVYVGGRPYFDSAKGVTSQYYGGYNGGGASYQGSSYNDNGPGGGATDFALVGGECTLDSASRYVRTSASYLSRILVAGGRRRWKKFTELCKWWIFTCKWNSKW